MEPARKFSRKREAILSVLRSTDTHPNAEWVYNQVKPLYPDLSLGTVYRNLALFHENGDIVRIGTVKGQERFDAKTFPHTHFVCNHCGKVLDVDVQESTQSFYEQIKNTYQLQPLSHTLTFFGLCQDCQSPE